MSRIVHLTTLPSGALSELVEESKRLGYLHVERLARDWDEGANRFDAPGEFLLGAHDASGALVGVVGLNEDPFEPGGLVWRVRRMYVLERARGAGVGRALMRELLGRIEGRPGRVVARAHPGATGFFERQGFTPTRDTPNWTHALTLEQCSKRTTRVRG